MGRDGDEGRTQAGQSVAKQNPPPGDDRSKGDVSKCEGSIDNIIGEDDVNGSKDDGRNGEGDLECSKGDDNKCGGDDNGSKVEDFVNGSKGGDTKCEGKDDHSSTGDSGVARSQGDGHKIPQRRQKNHRPNPFVQVCRILIS